MSKTEIISATDQPALPARACFIAWRKDLERRKLTVLRVISVPLILNAR